MLKFHHQIFFVLIVLTSLSSGCANKKPDSKKDEAKATSVLIGDETKLLLKDLKENGDYVNSNVYPSLIKASLVNESIGQNALIIDIRSDNEYSEGHIKGAINKTFNELPEYFENEITPFKYDKIILVCEDGQVSSYTTSLLRLMGYGNVYAMRWGMSAWNDTFAEKGWLSHVSGKYESGLEKSTNERPQAITMPQLNTGKDTGEEIGLAMFHRIFESGSESAVITADELFSDPHSYFVINLERKDKYENGHVPGAVRYKPKSTLGFTDEMASIPSDKTVVVYCGTGHNSGFAVAYLRVFGYDARMLKYGNNSFMYDKMLEEKTSLSWLPFTADLVNDFETVN